MSFDESVIMGTSLESTLWGLDRGRGVLRIDWGYSLLLSFLNKYNYTRGDFYFFYISFEVLPALFNYKE